MRPRLIPLTIGAATVLLTLRVVDLWQHAAPPSPSQPSRRRPRRLRPRRRRPELRLRLPAAAAPAPGPSSRAEPNNIPEYTNSELAVLQGLSSRREQIERRGTELDQREALLKAAEQRIEAKVQELKQLQGQMEALIRRYDDEEEAARRAW